MAVVLVDAGGSNIASVQFALQRLGVTAALTDDPSSLAAASHVIMPGVGAAQAGMAKLHSRGLVSVLRSLTQPVLGICLGMQLLFEHSEEGKVEGLGILPGRVTKLVGRDDARVPHMGWNTLRKEREDPLLAGIQERDAWAYFVHGFAVEPNATCVASTQHGVPIAAIVRQRNFCGTQFHPERSASLGHRLLENFLCQ